MAAEIFQMAAERPQPVLGSGLRRVVVTDTSFMRNPHNHKMSDTVETLDLPFFCGVVKGLVEALGWL
jgi:hypothetical protein